MILHLPFPSHPDVFDNIGSVDCAERLLRCCGEQFVKQHLPFMECETDHSGEFYCMFPSRYGARRVRKHVAELWPLIPAEAKRRFLTTQARVAIRYLLLSLLSFRYSDEPIDQELLDEVQAAIELQCYLQPSKKQEPSHGTD